MKITGTIRSLIMLIAAIAFFGNANSQSCPPGLVSYWKMDETSGTTLAEIVGGYTATRNSAAGNVSGKVGNSQRFTYTVNGSNNAYTYSEYATVPHNSAFNFPANSSFTISYWCRYTDYSYGFQDHIMISKGDWGGGGAYTDGMIASGNNGSGKISFMLRDNTGYKIDLEGPGGYGNGNWHHVACVRDEATNRNILYVDGTITDEATYNYTGAFTTTMDLQIGNLINGGTHLYFYKGDIDEVAIFNKALSASEISAIITSANAGVGICSVSNQAPTFTSTPVTTASVSVAYSYTAQATGSPSTMTYSLTTPPSGMTINSTSGVISWTPSSVGDFDVTVKASNGVNPDATQSFTITVSGTSPNITSVPVTSGMVGEPYSYTVQATGTQTGMTYSLVTSPGGMTINPSTGLISWNPASAGDVPVEVKADNGIDPFDTQSFTITVSAGNPVINTVPPTDAFVGVTYTYTVHAAGTQTGMTYSLTTKPAGMNINSTSGLISWTPVSAGDYPVEVMADNGIAPSDNQSFTITVTESVNCPDGIISLHRLDEGAGPDYADFYDEHNALASVSPTATTGIVNGAQLFGATTKLDIPDNGSEFDWLQSGSFSFECWVKTSTTAAMVAVGRNRTDYVAARWLVGTNSSGRATFELRDNGGPNTIISGTKNIADNQWHHIVAVRNGLTNVNVLYVDGVSEATLTKSYVHTFKADNPLNVTLGYLKVAQGEEYHFIGTIDEVAIFNRAVSLEEVQTFYNNGIPSGHCKGSNNFPYFTSTPATFVNEDANYNYNAAVTDPDASDVLTMSAVTKPGWLNFSWTAGQKNASLSGRPANDNVGENDVVLRVSDGEMSRDQIFRIVVNNVNDAPVKTSTPITSVSEGSAYSYTLTVTDVDVEDVISMTAQTLPSWLTFTWSAGAKSATLTGTPGNDDVGPNSVDIRISDGTVIIHEAYTITVNPLNNPPVITGQNTLSVNEDQSITIVKSDLTITDVDNPLTDITIAVQTGTNYTYSGNTVTPAANFFGQLTVNVKARDLSDDSQVFPVIVTVNPVNDPPVNATEPVTYAEAGQEYTYTLTVTDADAADVIVMTATTLPSWLNFFWTSGSKTATLSGTPTSLNMGANPVDISISDGHVTIHESYTITVNSQNTAPVITGQVSLSLDEDQSITILKSHLTITDIDNPASDITIEVQAGTNYTFEGNTVTPDANYYGQLSVNVKAHDLVEYGEVFPVLVTVNPLNDAPVIISEPDLAVHPDSLYAYVLTATDAENDLLTKTAVTLPDWLNFSASTGILSGIPAVSDLGQHLVFLQVSDGYVTVDKSFIITVTDATGISDLRSGGFIIYPVPVKDVLNVQFNELSEDAMVEIVSSTGVVVESNMVQAGTDVFQINVQDIKTGIYFCKLRSNAGIQIIRFLIAR